MRALFAFLMFSCLLACKSKYENQLNYETMASLGNKYKTDWSDLADYHAKEIEEDSTNRAAYIGMAEAHVINHIFGYVSRNESIPVARLAYEKAIRLDSTSSDILKLQGILHFLNWNWAETEKSLQASIKANNKNLSARHWYSLYLCAMDRVPEALAQHDTIQIYDSDENYLVGRGSMYYFDQDMEKLRDLMLYTVEKDTLQPWPYDWLGMAYHGIGDHDNAINTYFKAFELSDGTVEVGAGLGHALGHAGHTEIAKQMADYYEQSARTNYMPYCQRAFIHISIGEYDRALDLLETAYNEKSWFSIFMKIEHWYDPVRQDPRFQVLMEKMKYPNN